MGNRTTLVAVLLENEVAVFTVRYSRSAFVQQQREIPVSVET